LLEEVPERRQGVKLLEHALRWAEGRGSRLWLVLGDYGTGKSTFVRRFSYELAVRCQDNPDAPIPIAIDLSRHASAMSLEVLLTEHFREVSAGAYPAINPEVMFHLLTAGRVLLLLDGFDTSGVSTQGKHVAELFHGLVDFARAAGERSTSNH